MSAQSSANEDKVLSVLSLEFVLWGSRISLTLSLFSSSLQLHNAANANQKEKYEADLKKEIKKLQVKTANWNKSENPSQVFLLIIINRFWVQKHAWSDGWPPFI